MGRLRSKKFRAHASAAQSGAAKSKKPQAAATPSVSTTAAAAVAAAFGDDDAQDEELQPLDNEQSDADEDGDEAGSSGALSRGQRKRMKRRSAFMRKMGLVKRVVQEKEKAKKKEEQGAFAEIKELQDSLFLSDKELAAMAAGKISQSTNVVAKSESQKPKKLSGKQRQKIAVRELGQLKAVHTHPQFQTDPFAAIQMHLQNTVVQANQAALQAKDGGAKAKAGKKKASDMEVE